jgi:hypothetical protein
MAGIVRINGATSGYTELSAPSVAGNSTVTLPANSVDLSNSFGAWLSYTPTWTAATTNPSLGNGALVGRYIQIGKTVNVFVQLTIGSTTTLGTGGWIFSVPFAAKVPVSMAFLVTMLRSGIGWSYGQTNGGYFGYSDRTAPICNGVSVTSAAPFSWSTNDVLAFGGTYEAA